MKRISNFSLSGGLPATAIPAYGYSGESFYKAILSNAHLKRDPLRRNFRLALLDKRWLVRQKRMEQAACLWPGQSAIFSFSEAASWQIYCQNYTIFRTRTVFKRSYGRMALGSNEHWRLTGERLLISSKYAQKRIIQMKWKPHFRTIP